MKSHSYWNKQISDRYIGPEGMKNFVEDIQKDALSDPMAQTTDQQEGDITQSVISNQRVRIGLLEEKLLAMTKRWHESRRYLRAANRGAERNAQVIQLQLLRMEKQNQGSLEAKVWEWLGLNDEGMRLRMGELLPTEIRTCRAMLRAILGTKLLATTKPES